MILIVRAQVAVAHRVAWIYTSGSLEVWIGFLFLLFQDQCTSEIILGDEIVLSDRERVRPQVVIASPVRDLTTCAPCQRNQNHTSANCRPEADLLLLTEISDAKCNHCEDSDHRNVGVSVRHGGFSNLHQTDYRNQCA